MREKERSVGSVWDLGGSAICFIPPGSALSVL